MHNSVFLHWYQSSEQEDCTGYNLEYSTKVFPQKRNTVKKKYRNFFKKGIRLKGKKKFYETVRWGVGVQTLGT